jgi:hypothetical protein
MRASHVLSAARTMATSPKAAPQQATANLEALRAYAAMVGTEEAQKAVAELAEDVRVMASAPAAAKPAVAAAYRTQRGGKDFDKKD